MNPGLSPAARVKTRSSSMGRYVVALLVTLFSYTWVGPEASLDAVFQRGGWRMAHAAAQNVVNSITITSRTGAVQTNYPLQFGRPFIAGAIPDQPQVLINGAAATTQADVKNRYPDGSV